MTAEQQASLMIKGAISELPADDQKKVMDLAEQVRSLVKSNGEFGIIALALVGLEFQK